MHENRGVLAISLHSYRRQRERQSIDVNEAVTSAM